MYLLHVLHFQWLMLAVGGGLIFMLSIYLFYRAGWRPRKEEEEKARVPLTGARGWLLWFLGTFPWIITITLVGIAIWSVVYPLFKAAHPPNW